MNNEQPVAAPEAEGVAGLLPCPKCGSTNLLLRDIAGWELDCRGCELSLVLADDPSREGLVKAWNTRVSSDAKQEDQNSVSGANDCSQTAISKDSSESGDVEGDPWPADVELANALDRYARESGLSLEAQLCPYCPNVGYYAAGPTDAPEQVQCEFCNTTPNSLYRIKQAVTQVAKSSEASRNPNDTIASSVPHGTGSDQLREQYERGLVELKLYCEQRRKEFLKRERKALPSEHATYWDGKETATAEIGVVNSGEKSQEEKTNGK